MAYGTVKVDTVTFTYASGDTSTTFSGLHASTTNNLTLSGTASAATFTGTTANFTNTNAQNISVTTLLSGLAITGGTAGFTTVTGTTVTGTTANFVTLSGTTVTGNIGQFTSLTGATTTMTSGVFASGTEPLPSISFVSDPDTGIYSPGANQLAVATNGTGRLFVDASGRVALGGTTVTDSNLLNIQGSTSIDNVGVVLNKTNGTAQVWAIQNSGSLSFFNYTASSTALTINTSNQVGIGTSGPSYQLDLDGGTTVNTRIRIARGSDDNQAMRDQRTCLLGQ